MAAPTLEHNPSFTFPHPSPLDILVRKTSNRSVNASKSRNLFAAPSGQNRYPPSLSYTPHVASQGQQFIAQPPSPLLHTQFRGSTFSAATYDNHNSFLDTTMSTVGGHDSQEVEYRYRDDDASIYSTPSMLPPPPKSGIMVPDYSTGRPDSWDEGYTPTAASMIVNHTWLTPDPEQASNGESTLESEQGNVIPVPTVVISPAIEPASPALTPKRGGKTPISTPPPKFNFSRPGRLPVLPPEDHKQQVIERNAHRNRTQAKPQPTIPIPPHPGGVNSSHQGHPPQLSSREPKILPSINSAPPPPDQHILSQSDSTLNSSRGAEPHRSPVYNGGSEMSSSNPSTSSLPYQLDQVDHRSLYKSASKPDMSFHHGGSQSPQPNPYFRTSPLHQQQFPYISQSPQLRDSIGTESVYSDTPSVVTSSYLDSSTPQSSNLGGSIWLPKNGNIYSTLTALDPGPSTRPPGPISLNDPENNSLGMGQSLPANRASSVNSGKSAQSPQNKLRKSKKPGSGYESDGYISRGSKGKGGVELPHDTLGKELFPPDDVHHSTTSSASGWSAREDLHPPPAHLITNPHGGWLSRSVHHPLPPSSLMLPTCQDVQSIVASCNTDHYAVPLPNTNPRTTHQIPSDKGPTQPNVQPAPSGMSDTQAPFSRDRLPDRERMSELGSDSQISSPTSPMSEASDQYSEYLPSKNANGRISDSEEPPRSPTPGLPKMSVELPREPPPRAVSPAASVYSQYSFYQLDSTSPSPTGSSNKLSPRSPGFFSHSPGSPGPSDPSRPPLLSPTYIPSTRRHHTGTRSPSSVDTLSPTAPSTAQDYLQLGIQHHEANRLKDSAICFEKSAKEAGGCGVGMVMWGLTLRHGWGCEKDEARGFKWLQKAAEGAVTDLESSRKGGLDTSGVQVRFSAFSSLHRR